MGKQDRRHVGSLLKVTEGQVSSLVLHWGRPTALFFKKNVDWLLDKDIEGTYLNPKTSKNLFWKASNHTSSTLIESVHTKVLNYSHIFHFACFIGKK